MFLDLSLCSNPNFLSALLFLKIVGKIIFIIVPLVLIYRTIVPFAKLVIGGEDYSKFIPNVIKSFVAAIIVFFIPSLMNYFFGILINNDSFTSLYMCMENSSLESIKLYREAEKISDDEEREAVIKSLNEAVKEKKDKEEAMNKALGEYNKKRVEKEKAEREAQQQSSSGSSPGSTTGSSVSAGTYTIHVGDSRTVGMCATITGSYSGCSYSSGGVKYYGNDIFIAEGSQGYSWFASTAVPAINNIISSNPNTTYNILSYMGVNFLLSDIDKYISKYNELATGDWSKQNIILVSVNPVNEQVEAQNGYSTKNANIITFNTKLKNGINASNMTYCDVYNAISSNFSTSDGLHYSSSTYQSIYSKAKSCI